MRNANCYGFRDCEKDTKRRNIFAKLKESWFSVQYIAGKESTETPKGGNL